jgi:transcription elongation GreA/GreB family factor
MNNGKDINVQLVSTENNRNENTNGIQKIYYKSPLAKSLLGHTKGDIVKIGNLDNFVEIIKISN